MLHKVIRALFLVLFCSLQSTRRLKDKVGYSFLFLFVQHLWWYQFVQDMVGYNVHAFQWMRREAEAADAEQLFREAGDARRAKDKRRRTRHAVKRPIVTVTWIYKSINTCFLFRWFAEYGVRQKQTDETEVKFYFLCFIKHSVQITCQINL